MELYFKTTSTLPPNLKLIIKDSHFYIETINRMEYRYDNVLITNLPVVATKIARLLGVMPTGVSDTGNTTIIMFASELTPVQKTSLDSFMSGSNLDVIPVTGNTTYTLGDLENIKASTGLDFDIYPSQNGLVVQFQKILTNTEKNTFKNAVASLLTIT